MTLFYIRVLAVIAGILFLTSCEPNSAVSRANVNQSAKSFACIAEQSPCVIELDDSRVEVLFDSERLIAEQAFNMRVNYQGQAQILQVTGFLEGMSMYMGKIPLFLEPRLISPKDENEVNMHISTVSGENISTENAQTLQSFQGEVLLGSCTEEVMTWRMWLIINTADNTEQRHMLTIKSYRN